MPRRNHPWRLRTQTALCTSPLDKIPENRREFVKPFVVPGATPTVEVLGNRLDAHFGDLPGWFGDRHPNLAGYHVIGDETAKYLAPLIRERFKK